MHEPQKRPERTLSIFGVGPFFVVLSLAYTAIGIGARLYWPETLTMTLLPFSWQVGIGGVLILIGLPFFIAALRILNKGFPQGELFTKGPYAACRHPVYGAWVVFLAPGLGLLMHSWPILGVVAAMYVTLIVLVRKEEAELLRLFGDVYREYRRRTPAVFPLLHRMWK